MHRLGFRRGWPLRAFGPDQRGAAMVVFALAVPALVGFAGLGVETGLWYLTKRQAQTAADAAALAAAIELSHGSNSTAAIQAALADSARNGFVDGDDTKVVAAPVAGVAGQIEVKVVRRQALLFSALFMTQPVSVGARAVAQAQPDGNACILALDPTASAAVDVQGNPTVNLIGCVVAANSTADSAIKVAGNAEISAQSLWTAGDYVELGNTHMTLAAPPVVAAWPLPDPYAGVSIPTNPGGCKYNKLPDYVAGQPMVLQPGVWCTDWVLHDTVQLQSGTYYLRNGSVTINAAATVACSNCGATNSGVTIVLTGPAAGDMTINGGATVTLRAPSGGGVPYPGMLLVQSRSAHKGGLTINGNSSLDLKGAVYFPNQSVDISGTSVSQASTGCVQVVAKKVRILGNASLDDAGCAAIGAAPIHTVSAKLVE